MKKIIQILPVFVLFCLVLNNKLYAQCPSDAFADSCAVLPKDDILVQSFTVHVKSKKDDKERTIALTLNKRTTYEFFLCSGEQDNGLVVSLFDMNNNFLITSFSDENDKEKLYNKITFKCQRTGTYYLSYFFHKRKNKGCGTVVLGIKQPKVKS